VIGRSDAGAATGRAPPARARVLDGLGIAAWVGPAFLMMFAVTAYPLAMNLVNSFLDEAPLGQPRPFVGLKHYRSVLSSPAFLSALGHTLQWTIGVIAVAFVIGLGLALLLNQQFPGATVARVLFLLPWMTPSIAGAIMWRFIYNTDFGVLNSALRGVGLDALAVGWTTNPTYSLWAAMVVHVWRTYGFYMMMLLGGLQAVPAEIVEAAEVDGAGPVRRLWSVILPQLQPVIVMLILLDVIWVTNNFDTIYVVTGGGPIRSSETLPLFVYLTAFASTRFSEAAAGAVIMFVIAGALIGLYLAVLARTRGRDLEAGA
jgi:multiple sugar transport system permease protein